MVAGRARGAHTDDCPFQNLVVAAICRAVGIHRREIAEIGGNGLCRKVLAPKRGHVVKKKREDLSREAERRSVAAFAVCKKRDIIGEPVLVPYRPGGVYPALVPVELSVLDALDLFDDI